MICLRFIVAAKREPMANCPLEHEKNYSDQLTAIIITRIIYMNIDSYHYEPLQVFFSQSEGELRSGTGNNNI